MSVLYDSSAYIYDDSELLYDGLRKVNRTHQATTPLSADMSVRVSKSIMPMLDIVITTNPYKEVHGRVAAWTYLTASVDKKIVKDALSASLNLLTESGMTRIVDRAAELTLSASEKNIAYLLLTIAVKLAGSNQKVINKYLSAETSLSTDQTSSIATDKNASLSISSDHTAKTSKVFEAAVLITLNQNRQTILEGFLYIAFSSSASAAISKTLSASFLVEAEAAKMAMLDKDGSLSLTSSEEDMAGRTLNASLPLSASCEYALTDAYSAYLLLAAQKTAYLSKTLSAAIALSGEKISLPAKTISAAMSLSAEDNKSIIHLLYTELFIDSTLGNQTELVITSDLSLSSSFSKAMMFSREMNATVLVEFSDMYNFLEKILEAETTLSASSIANTQDEYNASVSTTITADNTAFISKLLEGNLSMAADSNYGKFLSAMIELYADSQKTITKTLSAGLFLTGSEVRHIDGESTVAISIGAEALVYLEKALSAGMSLSASKERMAWKNLSADISVDADKNTYIAKVIEAAFPLTATLSLSKGAEFNLSITLDPSGYKLISKTLSSDINFTSQAGNITAVEISSAITAEVSRMIIVNKMLEATMAMAASDEKVINIIKEAATDMSADMEAAGENIFSSSVTLTASKTAQINKGLSVSISVTESGTKNIELVAEAAFSLSSDITIGGENIYEAPMSLSAAKSVLINKGLSVSITIEESGQKSVEAVADASVSLSSDVTIGGENVYNVSSTLSASKTIEIKKSLSAEVPTAASIQKATAVVISSGVVMSADISTGGGGVYAASVAISSAKSIIINKGLSAEIILVESGIKSITMEADVEMSLAPEIIIGGGQVFTADISVDSEKAVKRIGKNLQVYGGDGGSINFIAEKNVVISKTLSAGLGLSALMEGSGEVVLSSQLSLGASKSIFVRKGLNVTMSTTGSGNKIYEGVAEASISISGSMNRTIMAEFNATMTLSALQRQSTDYTGVVTILLNNQEARKRVGKTFTIREHTPSVWHSF